MSDNYVEQLITALNVLDRHEVRTGPDAVARAAFRKGRANKRAHYVGAMLSTALSRWRADHDIGMFVRNVIQASRWSPRVTIHTFIRSLGRRARKCLRLQENRT